MTNLDRNNNLDHQHYPRAPIIEAIIELRFGGAFSDKELARLRAHFKSSFPTIEDRTNIKVEVGQSGVTTLESPAGFKMTATNAVDLVLVGVDTFATVRLAPYERWEHFRAAAETNFSEFTEAVGRKVVSRIGVRFMNRLDVPLKEVDGSSLNKFLKVGVSIPLDVSSVIEQFSFTFQGVERSTGAKLNINSGVMPPALIDHLSLLLDIDVYWDSDIPGRIDKMFEKVEQLRHAKNSVFEHSITDQARELFR
jgi:uncharacterized protein (TIGR04255 family)